MCFLFMPAGHIALLFAENLVGVRVQYAKFNVQYRHLLHDRFSGKVKGDFFQVYNNYCYCISLIYA